MDNSEGPYKIAVAKNCAQQISICAQLPLELDLASQEEAELGPGYLHPGSEHARCSLQPYFLTISHGPPCPL